MSQLHFDEYCTNHGDRRCRVLRNDVEIGCLYNLRSNKKMWTIDSALQYKLFGASLKRGCTDTDYQKGSPDRPRYPMKKFMNILQICEDLRAAPRKSLKITKGANGYHRTTRKEHKRLKKAGVPTTSYQSHSYRYKSYEVSFRCLKIGEIHECETKSYFQTYDGWFFDQDLCRFLEMPHVPFSGTTLDSCRKLVQSRIYQVIKPDITTCDAYNLGTFREVSNTLLVWEAIRRLRLAAKDA